MALWLRVHQAMPGNPISLRPEASVQEAVSMFNNHSISCIPRVSTNRTPVRILSGRDILQSLAAVLQDR